MLAGFGPVSRFWVRGSEQDLFAYLCLADRDRDLRRRRVCDPSGRVRKHRCDATTSNCNCLTGWAESRRSQSTAHGRDRPAVTSRYQAAQLVRQLCGGEFVTAYGSIRPVADIRRAKLAVRNLNFETSTSGLQLSAEQALDFFGFEAVRQREELLPVARHSCALQSAPIRMFDAERMDGLDSSAQRQRAKVVLDHRVVSSSRGCSAAPCCSDGARCVE
jgi:hypothetical protein